MNDQVNKKILSQLRLQSCLMVLLIVVLITQFLINGLYSHTKQSAEPSKVKTTLALPKETQDDNSLSKDQYWTCSKLIVIASVTLRDHETTIEDIEKHSELLGKIKECIVQPSFLSKLRDNTPLMAILNSLPWEPDTTQNNAGKPKTQ